MATDATGVPTSLGIPKIDPDADAPSGLGTNAAMDSIDTLIGARVSKPAGIVSGEVPVWNGASWDRSSVTRVGPTSLGTGTPDATKFLRGDGAWSAAGLKTSVSALSGGPPGSPADTDLWIATSVDPNNSGATWVFQFQAAQATYKWVFLGGSAIALSPANFNPGVLGTFQSQAGAGNLITLLRAGDYEISMTGYDNDVTTLNNNGVIVGYTLNGAQSGKTQTIGLNSGNWTGWFPFAITDVFNAAAANTTVGQGCNPGSRNQTLVNTLISIRPRRII